MSVIYSSLSFDRAAGFYDSTRNLPKPVAYFGVQAILDAAGPAARILDVGTGTGRISVPMLVRGADLIGCDLSPRMMSLLRGKYPQARLARADAAVLPFPADHFDALTTCQVMHLVGPWRVALEEFRRVLKPGGIYINARTRRGRGQSVREQIRNHWKVKIEELGGEARRPGVQNDQELLDEFEKMGAQVKQVEVVRFSRTYTVREVIEETASRIHSHTWEIPDDIFVHSIHDLWTWAGYEFGDLDRRIDETACFTLDIVRYQSP